MTDSLLVCMPFTSRLCQGSLDVSRNETASKSRSMSEGRKYQEATETSEAFLNGRYINNLHLYALESAYNNMLMTGKFPFCRSFGNPPEMVDINVHPKNKVKFSTTHQAMKFIGRLKTLLQCARN